MSREDVLLTVAVLTLMFSVLTFLRPFLRSIWKNWLRFRWYRTVVALSEDRSYTRVDLPDRIKRILLLLLHPLRRWHGRPTSHENAVLQFRWCPFYNPTRCVKPWPGSSTEVSCPTTAACYKLGGPNQNISEQKSRLIRHLRHRPAKHRATRVLLGIRPRPCEQCGHPPAVFDMGSGLYCPGCFGVPPELHDLLTTN